MRKFCLPAIIFLSSNILQAQDKIFTAHLTVKGITTATSFDQDGKISGKTETENAYLTEFAPLVKGDYSIRLYISVGGISPNINPNAPKQKEQYRDCLINEWSNNETSKYGLSPPNSPELNSYKKSSNTPETVFYSRYTPITEAQIQNLIKNGSAAFNLKYYSYSKNMDGGKISSESETKIYVTPSIH